MRYFSNLLPPDDKVSARMVLTTIDTAVFRAIQEPFGPSHSVVQLQPIKINLQEESCLRITSFVADGIVVNPVGVLPDTSVNALYFSLKEIDLTISVDVAKLDQDICKIVDNCSQGQDFMLKD